MNKKQKQTIVTTLIVIGLIVVLSSLGDNIRTNTQTFTVANPNEKVCYTNEDPLIKMCSLSTFEGKTYTSGDYIEISCESPETILYKDSKTSQCDSEGCLGVIVSNPYRLYLKSSDSGKEISFVCYRNNGEVWNRRGVFYFGFDYVECKDDYDCLNKDCIDNVCVIQEPTPNPNPEPTPNPTPLMSYGVYILLGMLLGGGYLIYRNYKK